MDACDDASTRGTNFQGRDSRRLLYRLRELNHDSTWRRDKSLIDRISFLLDGGARPSRPRAGQDNRERTERALPNFSPSGKPIRQIPRPTRSGILLAARNLDSVDKFPSSLPFVSSYEAFLFQSTLASSSHFDFVIFATADVLPYVTYRSS